MAMRERPALRVLSRQPHRDPLEHERAERQRFRLPPVDPALFDRRQPPLELALELGMHCETVGNAQKLRGEIAELLRRHTGVDLAGGVARNTLLARLGRNRLVEARAQPVVRLPEEILGRGGHPLRLVGREHALLHEPCRVELAHGRVRGDLLDHQGLRVGSLVLLVVPETAVADEIDHDVVAEARTVGERKPHSRDRGLGIVGVDVHDRHVEALGEVG